MKKICLFIFIILLSICAYCENFSFAMLNVGQGLNIVVINDNKALIYDCGTSDYNNINFEENKYCFDKVTKPYLEKNNIKEIEYAILSHPNTDHYVGYLNAFELYKVNNFFHNGREQKNRNYKELINIINRKNIKNEYIFNGKKFQLGDADCEVLGPFNDLNSNDPDENSIVLKITYKNKSFLLTGDIGQNAEPYYIDRYKEKLKSDVLVLAGHGTKYSSSQNFLNYVLPQFALISCAKNNSYYLPHPQLLKRLRNATILGTYLNGSIVLKVKENKIVIERDKK